MVRAVFSAALLGGVVLLTSSALAQTITSVAPGETSPSGRVRITGAGFGTSGSVTIGGEPAIVSRWSSGEVVAFVPETAGTGSVPVLVEPIGGGSATSTVTVVPRTTDGRIRWRFLLDSYAIAGQPPGIGLDGSVYVDEGFGDLYAIGPDGGLDWIYDTTEESTGGLAGGAAEGPIVVASDGAIIVGGTLLGGFGRIHAVNPDGTRRWVFQTDDTQGVIVGPGIGPDGNIYAAVDNAFTGAIGVFSLDSAGNLRWSDPGSPAVGEYGQAWGRPIAFGSDRFHFAAKPTAGSGPPILWTFSFDGDQEWVSLTGFDSDPVTDDTGRVIVGNSGYGVTAYDSSGAVDWQNPPPQPGFSALSPTRAPNGDIFTAHAAYGLWSLTPDGDTRYYIHDLSHGHMRNLGVTPDGAWLLCGGRQTFGVPGWVRAYSTADGSLEWQVDLAAEGGDLVTNSRPSFSPDGSTAYFCVSVLGSSTDSYVYAIDITAGGTAESFARGDCNADGAYDIADAIRTLATLFVPGSPAPQCPDACDSNDDGGVDISDAILTISALFSAGADPAAPFGGCGTDPTPDALDCPSFAACP